MRLKFYFYDKCDSCRKAIKFLRRHDVPFDSIPIRDRPPSLLEIKRMLAQYEGEVRRLFNTSGRDYQAMKLKDRIPTMSEDEAIGLLAANGNLIKRPFALKKDYGRVGFKEEEWKAFLP